MATVQGSLSVETSFSQALAHVAGSPAVLVPQRFSLVLGPSLTPGADQCDLKHTRLYRFTGSPIPLDLSAAADDLGTANFARLRVIIVRLLTAVDGQSLTLGGAGANPWTAAFSGTYTIAAGTAANPAVWVATAPNATAYPVTPTSKVLLMDPGSAAFDASVEIVGSST